MKRFISLLLFFCMSIPIVSSSATEKITWLICVPLSTKNWGNDLVSREIIRKTGIEVEFIQVDDSQKQLLDILMASDTPPELITCARDTYQVEQLIAQKRVWNLDVLAQECGYSMDALLGEKIAQINRSGDGGLYMCPGAVCTNTEEAVTDISFLPCLIVRSDFLHENSRFDFTTPTGFLDALRQIKQTDDTLIPLGLMPFTSTGCISIDRILREFLGIPTIKNGVYADPILNADFIKWLLMLAQANREELLDEKAFICDSSLIAERLSAGQYAVYLGDASQIAQPLQSAKDQGIDYSLVPGPRNQTGDPPIHALDSLNYGRYATLIASDSLAPLTAMRLLAWILEDEGQETLTLGPKDSMWKQKKGSPSPNQAPLKLYNKSIQKYYSVYGGAGQYAMLVNSLQKINTWGYRLDVLYQARTYLQQFGQDLSKQRAIFFLSQRNALSEYYLLLRRWGDVLPRLLNSSNEESFYSILNNYLTSRQADGYETFIQTISQTAADY